MSIIWGKTEKEQRRDYISQNLDVISISMKVLLHINHETVSGKHCLLQGLLKER